MKPREYVDIREDVLPCLTFEVRASSRAEVEILASLRSLKLDALDPWLLCRPLAAGCLPTILFLTIWWGDDCVDNGDRGAEGVVPLGPSPRPAPAPAGAAAVLECHSGGGDGIEGIKFVAGSSSWGESTCRVSFIILRVSLSRALTGSPFGRANPKS